jgi:hypothetical protein
MNSALLKRAAADYFNEGYEYAEIERTLKNTEPALRAEAYETMRPKRSVPDGCFAWISHLVWLERLLEIADPPLTGEEAEGLLVLKRERSRFQAEHPPCPKCGMPNEEHAFKCRECFAEIPH